MSKTKRRQYGSGSVHRRPDGYWNGTIEAGYTARGTRRRITVTAKTEAEARARLKEKQRQIAQDGFSDVARTTVKAWAEQWLDIIVTDLRPSSYNATRGAVRNWIIPTIGHKQLDRLTPADVRAVENAQRKAGRSSSTIKRTHSDLTALLKAALVEGHAIPARVFATKAPPPAANNREDIPIPDALAILKQASTLSHGSRWAIALLQGMRQAECLGLTWPEVDFDKGTLAVSWQLKALPYLDTKDRSKGFRIPDGYEVRRLEGALHLVRPKSEAGRRVIPLVPWALSALEHWREIAPVSPYGLVWPAVDGTPADVKDDAEEWKALQVTAEVGHQAGRFYDGHEARHTTATLLMELKVDPAIITAIMGHSKITTSRGYMHANVEHARKALEQVAERLQLA
jgi:integrase